MATRFRVHCPRCQALFMLSNRPPRGKLFACTACGQPFDPHAPPRVERQAPTVSAPIAVSAAAPATVDPHYSPYVAPRRGSGVSWRMKVVAGACGGCLAGAIAMVLTPGDEAVAPGPGDVDSAELKTETPVAAADSSDLPAGDFMAPPDPQLSSLFDRNAPFGAPLGLPGGFGSGPGGPPFGPQGVESNNDFIRRLGRDRVVIVKAFDVSDSEFKRLSKKLPTLHGVKWYRGIHSSGEVNCCLECAEDIHAFAEQIDFATVTSIDEENRTLTLELEAK